MIALVTILFAGHNFHFIESLAGKFSTEGHRVIFDKWTGHDNHDLEESFAKLGQANIIICEWGLGNSVWYSKHVNKYQKLYIRFHRQEIETEFPAKIHWGSVQKIIFVSSCNQNKIAIETNCDVLKRVVKIYFYQSMGIWETGLSHELFPIVNYGDFES